MSGYLELPVIGGGGGGGLDQLTGDVLAGPGTGSQVATIAAGVVSNIKLSTMPAHTFKGNNTGATGAPVDLTQAQLTAELNTFTDTLQGVVPASGGGTVNFLRADGTWAPAAAAFSGTANRAVITDGSGALSTSSTTSTEIGYVNGVTSSIQAQLDGKALKTITISTTAPLTGGGDLSANRTFAMPVATSSADGYLSAVDWATFDAKQPAGNFITDLTGDVTASGPGSVAATLATVNSNVGSFGSADKSVSVTVNAKGLVTAASESSIQITESQVTNLTTDLAAKVAGPASSVASEIVLFDGITGKLVKSATGTGVVHATSGVYSTGAVDLTSEVTGILPEANGGTGQSSLFPLIAPGGSVTAPSYAFSESGNDTGIYSTGDGNFSIASNGTQLLVAEGLRVSVTGVNQYMETNRIVTPEVGTETASGVVLKANNVTKITLIDGNEVASSFSSVVPVDNVGGNQFQFQTDVNPNVGTTNANRTGMYNFMNVDGAATGYPLDANYIATSARVQHSGDGAMGYASASDNSAYFAASGGSVNGFKGYNMDTQFGAGYTINSMSNYFSSVSTTGGIVNNLESYGSNINLTDASVGTSQLFNGNLNITGTSVLSGGINGVTANLQLADSADGTGQNMNGFSFNGAMSGTTKIGGMNAVGANVQLTDSAQNLGGINLGNFSLDCRDSAVGNGINGVSTNIQVRNSATANGITYGNFFGSTDNTAVVSNVTALAAGANFGGSSSIGNVQMLSTNGYLHDSAHIDNFSGGVIGVSMGGTSTVTNFQPFNINAQIQDTAVVTNAPTLMNVNLSTYADALPGLTGIQVNLGAASLSPAALAAGQQKVGLNINDGILNSYSQYSNDGFTGTGAVLHNNLGGQYSIGAGFPVSNQYHFLNFIGWNVAAEDDFNDDGLGVGLGLSINGLANQVSVAAGKTIKDMNYMMAGGSTPPSSAGAITNLAMFRALGILPAGGTVAITNLYGFKADPVMDYAGATNTFGIYVGAATADNYFSKSVTIGQEKTTNSDIAFEIGSAKATMLGAMNTTARNALTAVERMMIYNTTTQQYEFYNGTVWGPMSGGGGSSPLTTKGDLYGYDTADARVPVGTDGQVLTADSGAALGVSWQTPTTGITELTGDVTAGPGSGSQAATIATSAVTNAKLADMAQATVKGRAAGAGTGAPVDLTQTQLTELVNSFTTSLSGAAPASGGGTTNFLRADGTWAAPPDTGITQLTGDATAGPGSGSQALTLATVNSNVGSFGSATQVAGITVNAKGLITAASNTSIQITESQVTNLVTDLAAKQNAKYTVVDGGNAAYSIVAADRYVRSGTTLTADRAYTLPPALSGNVGEIHDIKNVYSQTFNIILTADGSDLIDGTATRTLYPGDSYTVICAAVGAWDVI